MAINPIGSSGLAPTPAAPRPTGSAPSSVRVDAAPSPAPQPSQEQVQQAIESVKRTVEPAVSNSLEFSIDNDTGKTIVSVTDAKTGEMIRQIPSKELLEIAKSLDRMQGLLLRQKA